MTKQLEVLFTPAEFAALAGRDLSNTACVVFDVFCATSTIVTALANGVTEIIPVSEFPDALTIRKRQPDILLAGERDGVRIRAALTEGVDFDFGNSPREFVTTRVSGKTVVISTTNGSRALRACANARSVFVGSFLNLRATAARLAQLSPARVLMVCSGTGEEAAYEDILGAGALADLLVPEITPAKFSDSANTALQIYRRHAGDLSSAVEFSKNGRRLSAMPDLRDDVPFCLRRDIYPLVAKMDGNAIKKAD